MNTKYKSEYYPEWMTTKEAEEYLRVPVGFLARDRAKKRASIVYVGGRPVLYKKSDLDAYMLLQEEKRNV